MFNLMSRSSVVDLCTEIQRGRCFKIIVIFGVSIWKIFFLLQFLPHAHVRDGGTHNLASRNLTRAPCATGAENVSNESCKRMKETSSFV